MFGGKCDTQHHRPGSWLVEHEEQPPLPFPIFCSPSSGSCVLMMPSLSLSFIRCQPLVMLGSQPVLCKLLRVEMPQTLQRWGLAKSNCRCPTSAVSLLILASGTFSPLSPHPCPVQARGRQCCELKGTAVLPLPASATSAVDLIAVCWF